MDDATLTSDSDVGGWRLRLRPELKSSLRSSQGKPFVLVHDPLRSQFHRLGVHEWRIARLLDGNRTLRQIIHDVASAEPANPTSPADITRLVHWLAQTGLADGEAAPSPPPGGTSHDGGWWYETLQRTRKLARWNPLFLRVPLPHPEPLLRWLHSWAGWLLSPLCFVVWSAVCLFGGYSIFSQWDRFGSSLGDVLAVENWLYLLLTWIALKFVHELAHGLACLRFGGTVPRCGVMLVLFSPIAYVDVTSAWSFRSKWQRIFVSAAGMYVEFFIAALAALIWAYSRDPYLETLSRNVVLAASVSTLLFNCNFLMKFDGYYILADLLDIQNLYGAGQQYLRYFGRRYFLNLRAIPPQVAVGQLTLIKVYGLAAFLWRLLFCVGMLIVAANLFHGAGIVLAVFSAVIWFALPVLQFGLYLWKGHGQEQPDRRRFALVMAAVAALAAIVLALPWPGATRAPGIVEFAPLVAVRVDSPGFVREVLVRPGQHVKAAQILVRLDNPELVRRLADLDLRLKRLDIERRVLHRDNELAKYLAAGKKHESLEQQREQLRRKVDTLTVRAPIRGQVIGSDLDSLVACYVEMGQELMAVGSAQEKEVRISIHQADIMAFRERTHETVRLRVHGRPSVQVAILRKVHPRASLTIIHPALAATAGGPLAVQRHLGEPAEDPRDVELVEPHFEGLVTLSREVSERLYAGERCCVSLGRGQQSVGAKLLSMAADYFQRKRASSS